jgi:hypothetical protein
VSLWLRLKFWPVGFDAVLGRPGSWVFLSIETVFVAAGFKEKAPRLRRSAFSRACCTAASRPVQRRPIMFFDGGGRSGVTGTEVSLSSAVDDKSPLLRWALGRGCGGSQNATPRGGAAAKRRGVY